MHLSRDVPSFMGPPQGSSLFIGLGYARTEFVHALDELQGKVCSRVHGRMIGGSMNHKEKPPGFPTKLSAFSQLGL